MSKMSDQENYLLSHDWQKVHNGLNTGYFLPSAKRFCNSLQEAFGFQLAIDAVGQTMMQGLSKQKSNEHLSDSRVSSTGNLRIEIPSIEEVEPEDFKEKPCKKSVTPLKRKTKDIAEKHTVIQEKKVKTENRKEAAEIAKNSKVQDKKKREKKARISKTQKNGSYSISANLYAKKRSSRRNIRQESPTKIGTKRTKPISFSPSSNFNKIWNTLKLRGWNYFKGERLIDFFYALPEVKKKNDGIRGKNMFTSSEAYEYLLLNEPRLIAEIMGDDLAIVEPQPIIAIAAAEDHDEVKQNLKLKFDMQADDIPEISNVNENDNNFGNRSSSGLNDSSGLVVRDRKSFFNRLIWPILKKKHNWTYAKQKGIVENAYLYVDADLQTTDGTYDYNSGKVFRDGDHFVSYCIAIEESSIISPWDKILLTYYQDCKLEHMNDTKLIRHILKEKDNLDSSLSKPRVLKKSRPKKMKKPKAEPVAAPVCDASELIVVDCKRFFNRFIWPILKGDHYWDYAKSKDTLSGEYVYVASEFDKSSKTFNYDSGLIFRDGEHFVEYATILEKKDDKLSEWDEMLLGYFQEVKLNLRDDNKMISKEPVEMRFASRSTKRPPKRLIKQNNFVTLDDVTEDIESLPSEASEESDMEELPIPRHIRQNMQKIMDQEGGHSSYSDLSQCFTKPMTAEILENSSNFDFGSYEVTQIKNFLSRKICFREDDIDNILSIMFSPFLSSQYFYVTGGKGAGKSLLMNALQHAIRKFLRKQYYVIYEKDNKSIFMQVLAVLQKIIHKEENEFTNETEERRYLNALEMKLAFQTETLDEKFNSLSKRLSGNEEKIQILLFIDGDIPDNVTRILWLQQYLLDFRVDLRIVHAQHQRPVYFNRVASNSVSYYRLKSLTTTQKANIVNFTLVTEYKKSFDKTILVEAAKIILNITSDLSIIIDFFLKCGSPTMNVSSITSEFENFASGFNGCTTENALSLGRVDKLIIIACYLCSTNTPKQNLRIFNGSTERINMDKNLRVGHVQFGNLKLHYFTETDISLQYKRMAQQIWDVDTNSDNLLNWKAKLRYLKQFVAERNNKFMSTITHTTADKLLQAIEYPTSMKWLIADQ